MNVFDYSILCCIFHKVFIKATERMQLLVRLKSEMRTSTKKCRGGAGKDGGLTTSYQVRPNKLQ